MILSEIWVEVDKSSLSRVSGGDPKFFEAMAKAGLSFPRERG